MYRIICNFSSMYYIYYKVYLPWKRVVTCGQTYGRYSCQKQQYPHIAAQIPRIREGRDQLSTGTSFGNHSTASTSTSERVQVLSSANAITNITKFNLEEDQCR